VFLRRTWVRRFNLAASGLGMSLDMTEVPDYALGWLEELTGQVQAELAAKRQK
jgi:hypothetical protein